MGKIKDILQQDLQKIVIQNIKGRGRREGMREGIEEYTKQWSTIGSEDLPLSTL